MDDSSQNRPAREGMGPLAAVGAIHVPSESAIQLEADLTTICSDFGFPEHEEFKWSPSKSLWMREGLVAEERERFYRDCLEAAERLHVGALVAIEDKKSNYAISTSASPEEDVTRLLLERANNHLKGVDREAIVISDRPSGGNRKQEDQFLANCLETLRDGTDFVQFDHLSFMFTADSTHMRLLQLADLVTGCSLAYVAGHKRHHSQLFDEAVFPLLRSSSIGVIGGFGLKLHPDYRYRNLYYWLLGDDFHQSGTGYPLRGWAYEKSPDKP